MRPRSQALVLWLALFFAGNALAEDRTELIPARGNTVLQPLDWKNPDETLFYHNCGCGDSCWTASLYKKSQIKHNTPTGKPIASLRCDCDKLWAKTPQQKKETVYEATCDRLNTNAKFSLIPNEVSTLTSHPTPQE